MKTSKEFMLMFRYEPSNDFQPTAAQLNEQQQLWGAFIGSIASQGKLVSTYQLGFSGKQISATKVVTEGMHIADKQTLGGNMVITAEGFDEAVEMAKGCPILLMGGSVEVRDIMPMG
jgi:hypothetical protein